MYGFELHINSLHPRESCTNLVSAYQFPNIVDEKLQKEIKAGRIAGPFETRPFENFHASPLGIVKKKLPGTYRLIHHLSSPKNMSVNDSIPEEFCTVKYSSIADAIAKLKTIGRHSPFSKTDVKNAFRIIPLNPSFYPFLGLIWDNKFYFDKCLPMGLSESCKIFEEFSTALEWAAYHRLGASAVVHVLDDFLFIESTTEKSASMLKKFKSMCEYVGIPIAEEKTFGPSTVMEFLGITLDSDRMEARLPKDKLHRCNNLISEYKNRKSITLRNLQSLIGTLQFATSVILPGRTFLRRLIDLTIGVKRNNYSIRLKKDARLDLCMWEKFLLSHNGRSFFLNDFWLSSIDIDLYTDASSTIGYGAVLHRKWFFGTWEREFRDLHINILELYPITAALLTWGHLLSNHCITIYTDNQALSYILNKQTSPCPKIMHMIRALVLCCIKHNILFRAFHIFGIDNCLADNLSRFQVHEFKRLHPLSDPLPTPLPETASQQVLLKL